MKILLTALNSQYIHSNPALFCLRAYAGEELREHIEIAEYTINHLREDILRDIYKRQPDVIAVSCYIWNIKMVKELVREIHCVMPKVPIWLGGPEVSYDPDQVMEEMPEITGIMVGEGEKTFKKLAEYYTNYHMEHMGDGSGLLNNLSEHMGDGSELLKYLSDDEALFYQYCNSEDVKVTLKFSKPEPSPKLQKFKVTKKFSKLEPSPKLQKFKVTKKFSNSEPSPKFILEARELTNLSSVPFIYENLEDFDNRIIYYESSRGCPFSCSYCLSSIDKSVRFRDVELVKRELKFFLDHKVPQVKFVDRTFNCRHEHAMAIWKFIQENDNGVTNFHFEVSGDILNEEEIALLQTVRPGLFQMEIGVQSTNQQTIKEIHRTMNLLKLEAILARLQKKEVYSVLPPSVGGYYHLHIHLDLIAGLPYENYESFIRSFNEIYEMHPEQLQLGFLKVLKGSYMHEHAKEYGIVYSPNPPYEVFYTNWISFDEILQLKAVEEMLEVYYNSNRFHVCLSLLEPLYESKFELYRELAKFYESHGYFNAGPSRIRRYEILLEFAMQRQEEQKNTEQKNAEQKNAEQKNAEQKNAEQKNAEQKNVMQNVADQRQEEVENMAQEFCDALAMDLYLCENRKSRPEFCRDLSQYKEAFRSFYEGEECRKKYLQQYEEYDCRQLSRMTHIEMYKDRFWLFDYKKKSPLTGEAQVYDITEDLR